MVFLVACQKNVSSVSLNKDSLTLKVGDTYELIATVLPEKAANKAVTFSIDNPLVATIMPNGLVKALSQGTATITVTTTDGGFTANCLLEVIENNISVTGVIINKTLLVLGIDKTETLIATVLPENADNKNVIWYSSDPNVANVNNGLVKALSGGKATISVITEDGGFKATCLINVFIEPEMVDVEGGNYPMGCSDDECVVSELPVHEVTLSSFRISKYQVTQKEWETLMGNNPSSHKGDNLPVEMVSWNDIQGYIQKLNTLTGKNYRLPTEAEWEFAARGGNYSNGYKYSGSDNAEEVAWLDALTHPVGEKKPNELGIFDMSGNVFEACSDWVYPYSEEPQVNPTGPSNGTHRVFRGGRYNLESFWSRVSCRFGATPEAEAGNAGFRLAHP